MDAGTCELQALVAGAVDADPADQRQDQILALDVLRQFARQFDLDGRRHLEPRRAARHGAADVGLPHPRGQGVQGAVRAGVGIGADDNLAGGDEAFVRQQGVFDAHAAYFKIIRNPVLPGEIAHLLAQRGRFDILARRK